MNTEQAEPAQVHENTVEAAPVERIVMPFSHLERFDKMPQGWKLDASWGSPMAQYIPICNGESMLNGGKKGLLLRAKPNCKPIIDSCNMKKRNVKEERVELTEQEKTDAAKATNDLARAKFKEKLLQELLFDLTVCKIEGWPISDYVTDLKTLIDSANSSVCGA